MSFNVENITVKYNFGATAIQNLSFSARKGEIFCIFGKSESGKTSLLKGLSGLAPIKDGKITLDGENYSEKSIFEKNVFLMHEDLGFFENKTLAYNLEYPLKIRRDPSAEIKTKEVAEKYGLSDLLNIKAKKLNKTDRVKAAFARCENRNADVFLFDNPFVSLENRAELFARFLPFLQEKSKTAVVIYATDSIDEIKKINGEVLILNYGIKHQAGTPKAIGENPSSVFVYKTFFPNATEFNTVVNENISIDLEGKEYFLDKNELLNEIFIGGKIIICMVGDDPTTARIYDEASEKLIYFSKIV